MFERASIAAAGGTGIQHLLVLSALVAGCTGYIESQAGAPPDSRGLGTANPHEGPLRLNGPSDEELRAKNPQLFEAALRYFPAQTAVAPRGRLFRLTREQLDATTASLVPSYTGASARDTLPRDPLQKNYEYSDNLDISAANFTPLVTWTSGVAAKASSGAVVDCSAEGNSPACLERGARAFVARAFRGVVSADQADRFATFFRGSVGEVGIDRAVADLVDVALTSPWYLFRDEARTDASGRLLPAQLLQNVSYTLADSPPDAAGLTVPIPGAKAFSDAQVADAVSTVMQTPAARQKLLRFFTSWLEVKEPAEFDISPAAFPEFTPEVAVAVVQDTLRFLDKQLAVAAPRLRDLTEASFAFASTPSSFLYGGDAGPGEVSLDPAQRIGIFGQPAVIASHSGPTTTRLVRRGVFFTRKIMCMPLGAPPAGVDISLPSGANGTERERIEDVTKPARCLACHAYINPFGFMQESYDAIGRYRTVDGGRPVDPSMSIDFLDEGRLTTDSTVAALRGLTRSLRFQECFVRQVFRFYAGRDETEGDDPLLRQLFFEFAHEESQDILHLLESLVSSNLFHTRSEVQ